MGPVTAAGNLGLVAKRTDRRRGKFSSISKR